MVVVIKTFFIKKTTITQFAINMVYFQVECFHSVLVNHRQYLHDLITSRRVKCDCLSRTNDVMSSCYNFISFPFTLIPFIRY